MVDNNTVVVVVDTNRPSYTECEELLHMTKTIVVLDHHRRGSEVIENAVLSYVEPYASSACEMVAEILQYFSDDLRIRNMEADCLYAGIMIDTNNFTTRAGVRTFEAAAFLRRSGADVTRVRKLLRDDLKSYQARAEAVRTAQIYREYYAIARCPSENLDSPTVIGAQAANELLNIAGVKASFVLTQYNNEVYISARAIDEINVQVMMEKYHIQPYDENTGKGLVRHVLIRYGFFTDEMMVCLIINGEELPGEDALVKSLREIPETVSVMVNVNKKRNNVILGETVRLLWGKPYITDKIGEISYQISPLSFFQVNPYQTGRLYGKALEYADLTSNETVWDLYCGIGTISLFLAQKAKMVRGVEIIPAAIENAKENAKRNGFTNTEFFVGKAEEVLPEQYARTGERADVIVVDPPRKGCDETLLATIIEMQPDRVVYVSCDSATLARDLKYLCAHGYQLKKVCPVDMFPNTVSVETVCLLSKLKSKEHIEIEVKMDELDLTAAESKATYDEIKGYVLEKHELKVSSLYISQVKRKCGLDVGQNYNLSKKEDAKVPQCPPEKEAAIMDALKHFQMI